MRPARFNCPRCGLACRLEPETFQWWDWGDGYRDCAWANRIEWHRRWVCDHCAEALREGRLDGSQFAVYTEYPLPALEELPYCPRCRASKNRPRPRLQLYVSSDDVRWWCDNCSNFKRGDSLDREVERYYATAEQIRAYELEQQADEDKLEPVEQQWACRIDGHARRLAAAPRRNHGWPRYESRRVGAEPAPSSVLLCGHEPSSGV